MRCLTYAESEAWFASLGAKIIENDEVSFPQRAGNRRRMFLPNLVIDASKLMSLAINLVDWLPNGCERMLWLKNWETYPPGRMILFEAVRRGCQENRRLIDAPGHLFQSCPYDRDDYDSRTAHDHEENAIMWGLFLLMIVLNWDGYLVAPNGDCIELYDNAIVTSSTDDAKIRDANALANRFNLKFR